MVVNVEKPGIKPNAEFRSKKAAQICAYFASQNSGSIDKLKLIKLVYLSERKFLSNYNHPILFDDFYSLPRGPICSNTLNGINRKLHDMTVWDEYIERYGDLVVTVKPVDRDVLDHISNAEMDVLEGVWKQFSVMTSAELSDYTHNNCPEYKATTKSNPITYFQILEALGEEDASEIANDISEDIDFYRALESGA